MMFINFFFFASSHEELKHPTELNKTSKQEELLKSIVRSFYFMLCFWLNLWILVNILLETAILKFISKEPFITSKFLRLAYTLIDP